MNAIHTAEITDQKRRINQRDEIEAILKVADLLNDREYRLVTMYYANGDNSVTIAASSWNATHMGERNVQRMLNVIRRRIMSPEAKLAIQLAPRLNRAGDVLIAMFVCGESIRDVATRYNMSYSKVRTLRGTIKTMAAAAAAGGVK